MLLDVVLLGFVVLEVDELFVELVELAVVELDAVELVLVDESVVLLSEETGSDELEASDSELTGGTGGSDVSGTGSSTCSCTGAATSDSGTIPSLIEGS